MTKSSTEAELLALSDSANQALHIRNFVISQGHLFDPVTLYQDNMSCMALIERGRSAAERTRHIAINYFWLKKRVDQGEVRVRHLGTKEVRVRHLLTKPLQGEQFRVERMNLNRWRDDIILQLYYVRVCLLPVGVFSLEKSCFESGGKSLLTYHNHALCLNSKIPLV